MAILADTVDIVIGVDPHKHNHTAAVAAAADTGKHHGSFTAASDPDGFAELVSFADEHPGTRCWVIEGCGSWGRGLATRSSPAANRSARSTARSAPLGGWARRPTTSTLCA